MLMPGFRSRAAHHSGAYRLFSRIGAYPPNAGKARLVGLLALLALACATLAACKHAPPEQALRDTIAMMQAAGESGDIDELMHAWLVWKKTGKTSGSGEAKDDVED